MFQLQDPPIAPNSKGDFSRLRNRRARDVGVSQKPLPGPLPSSPPEAEALHLLPRKTYSATQHVPPRRQGHSCCWGWRLLRKALAWTTGPSAGDSCPLRPRTPPRADPVVAHRSHRCFRCVRGGNLFRFFTINFSPNIRMKFGGLLSHSYYIFLGLWETPIMAHYRVFVVLRPFLCFFSAKSPPN